MTRYRWVILGAGTFAQSTFSASSVGIAALAPALRSHYHLSLGQVGIALGAIFFGMMPTLLPWGLLTDRIGERAVLAFGLGGAGVAMCAASLTKSFVALIVLLVLFGALGSSVNAASGRAVMGWFGADQRGLALGIRQAAVPVNRVALRAGIAQPGCVPLMHQLLLDRFREAQVTDTNRHNRQPALLEKLELAVVFHLSADALAALAHRRLAGGIKFIHIGSLHARAYHA